MVFVDHRLRDTQVLSAAESGYINLTQKVLYVSSKQKGFFWTRTVPLAARVFIRVGLARNGASPTHRPIRVDREDFMTANVQITR